MLTRVKITAVELSNVRKTSYADYIVFLAIVTVFVFLYHMMHAPAFVDVVFSGIEGWFVLSRHETIQNH